MVNGDEVVPRLDIRIKVKSRATSGGMKALYAVLQSLKLANLCNVY